MPYLIKWDILRDFMVFEPKIAESVITRAIRQDMGCKVKTSAIKKVIERCGLTRYKGGFETCIIYFCDDLFDPKDKVSIEDFFAAIDRQVKIAQEEIVERYV